jgi:SNF2 family DNA or RNA helicase
MTTVKILNEKSKRQTIEADLFLFPHQEAILNRLIEIETAPRVETLVGLLTDPPGSGKSFPLLALMLLEKKKFGKTQNLIVIPHSLHEQWIGYIKRFSKDLTFASLMYYGDITSLFYDARALFEYDILITTSSCFPMIAQTVRDIKAYFGRVIIDEIDSISFFTDTKVPAISVWLVSATAELTCEGKYKDYIKDQNKIECEPDFIKKSIRLPVPIIKHHNCFNLHFSILNEISTHNKELNALEFSEIHLNYYNHSITSSIDSLKSIYIDSSLEMNSLIGSIESLSRKMAVPELQKRLQVGVKEEVRKIGGLDLTLDSIKGANWKNKRYTELKSTLKKFSELCCNKLCPLCGIEFGNDSIRLEKTCCNKTVYHEKCLMDWENLHKKCPECWKDLTYTSDNLKQIEIHTSNYTDKLDELQEVIKLESSKKPNWKMLIFSDYVGTFNQIKTLFDVQGINYAELEGNQIIIADSLDKFKNGDANILLIHSQHYGGGLNLEFSDSIVLFHKTKRNEQLIGRAQRYGRKTQLFIHHLLYVWEK